MAYLNPKISAALLKPELLENPDQPCRLIVEMATPYTDKIATFVEANAGKVHREMRIVPSIVVELPYAAFQPMAFSPHVKKIWHDLQVRTLLDIAGPVSGSVKAREYGFTGKDVTVAVIDTGLFPHPDLIYPENRIVAWHDVLDGRQFPYDDNGHGTHVSGIIAGNGVASFGKYTGMAPEAKLVAIKAIDKEGSGNASDVIAALEWCIENQATYNIRAINLSIGATAQESALQDPLCRGVGAAWYKGMIVCTAAGNDGPGFRTINTPGISPFSITVGNLDVKKTLEIEDDIVSESSSRGPTIDNLMKPDLLAPGTEITSLRVGGGYKSLSGTSMAVPMVTGAVAQILQQWPSFGPQHVRYILKRNARYVGSQSVFEGYGALNMEGLFEAPKKSEAEKRKNIFSMFFGENSIFNSFFNKETS